MSAQEEVVKLSDLCHFFPKQMLATQIADENKYTLYGGAAGPGKSYWLRWYPIRKLIQWGKKYNLRGIRGALFSQDFPTLKDRQISKMDVEFPRWLGEIKDTKIDGLGFHLNEEYGGHVLLLKNLDDPSKYLSSEFAIIAVEELTENVLDKFTKLRTRMRWTGIEDTQFIAATNPGGLGHEWVKNYWIDHKFPAEEKEAHKFAYVKALPTDNPHLAKSYIETLDSLPEKWRKAYREGDWNIFEGQYFSEWSDLVHVVAPFRIPESWRKFGAYDHGRANPACFKWYAIDHDGNIYVYRELYVNKKDASDRWEVDKIAKEVTRITEENDEHLEYVVVDSAVFTKTGIAETIADVLRKNGIGKAGTHIPLMIPSHKDRIAGWAIMHQYLAHSPGNPPKMRYFSTCADSIRTIPTLIHDKIRVEDLDSDGEDHAADVDRYFLQTVREKSTAEPKSYEQEAIERFNKKIGKFNNNSPLRIERFQV